MSYIADNLLTHVRRHLLLYSIALRDILLSLMELFQTAINAV